MCKEQVSNKSVIVCQLTLDPCIINLLGRESRERSRAELILRPPRELFHLSSFIETIWKQPWQLFQRQVFVRMKSEVLSYSKPSISTPEKDRCSPLNKGQPSSAPGRGRLSLWTPVLNFPRWSEPSFGPSNKIQTLSWTQPRIVTWHVNNRCPINLCSYQLRHDPWIINTFDRGSRE